ncbi:[FeFe] hydrogenase H-cluster radical SAM maturase HydE [Prolixibacteraceae bacterium JC049]|nr:[FeFe] hydrogenase H-cluster radical SAM maturase HydE [Prolixibacteraceae bacterium JC049]
MEQDKLHNILNKTEFTKEDIVFLLSQTGEGRTRLFKKANAVKQEIVGQKVYFRGLIEFSNICSKDCFYCGIRKSNTHVSRYVVTDEEILYAAKYAYENDYASLVLQSGEISSPAFVDRVDRLLKEIKKISNGKLGITLSCGEQSPETYQRWFASGAHRYLLRIETSSPKLFYKIHPKDETHDYIRRLKALKDLRLAGYQVGSGVMIGLPFQKLEDLADDILFLKTLDVDMCGMGPYLEHEETPLFQYKDELWPKEERFDMALKMVAVLRLVMPDINIAAATALQAIDPAGREKAVTLGANVIMPNLTPTAYREEYRLYENKPCLDEDAEQCKNCLEARIHLAGDEIGYGEWGDSKHFKKRKQKDEQSSQN